MDPFKKPSKKPILAGRAEGMHSACDLLPTHTQEAPPQQSPPRSPPRSPTWLAGQGARARSPSCMQRFYGEWPCETPGAPGAVSRMPHSLAALQHSREQVEARCPGLPRFPPSTLV